MAASMGHQSRLSLAAGGTAIGSYTEAYEFLTESLRKQLTIVDTAGLRGTRSHPAERTRDGTYAVGGGLQFHATPAMLDLLLPRILGANEATDVFALAETLPEFDVLIDRVAKRFVYAGCQVNRATFRAAAGGPLELDLDVIGKTEVVSATANVGALTVNGVEQATAINSIQFSIEFYIGCEFQVEFQVE